MKIKNELVGTELMFLFFSASPLFLISASQAAMDTIHTNINFCLKSLWGYKISCWCLYLFIVTLCNFYVPCPTLLKKTANSLKDDVASGMLATFQRAPLLPDIFTQKFPGSFIQLCLVFIFFEFYLYYYLF